MMMDWRQLLEEHYGVPLNYWHELPDYPRTDWQYEVANEDTLTGYWEWAARQELDLNI